MIQKILLLLFCCVALTACYENGIYEKYKGIPDYVWKTGYKVPYEVEITDTNVLYNIYVDVRHTEFYPFSNLWLMLHVNMPYGQKHETRVELPLAEKDGKWLGRCLGDVCDRQILVQENAIFPQQGKYTFELEQIMRLDDLPGIMEMGIKIEKTDRRR